MRIRSLALYALGLTFVLFMMSVLMGGAALLESIEPQEAGATPEEIAEDAEEADEAEDYFEVFSTITLFAALFTGGLGIATFVLELRSKGVDA